MDDTKIPERDNSSELTPTIKEITEAYQKIKFLTAEETALLLAQERVAYQLLQAKIEVLKKRIDDSESRANRKSEEAVYEAKRAITDDLTQLPNRRAWNEKIKEIKGIVTRSEVSVLFVDADDLKKINDVWGHQAGDHALVLITEALKRIAERKSDFVARIGGDEFGLILVGTNNTGAKRVIDEIYTEVELICKEDGDGFFAEEPLKISIGAATRNTEETLEELINRADQEMYSIKNDKNKNG